MEQLLLVVYVLLSVAMTALILLQQGKGADAGASFGSGASQTVFGSGGSGNALTRGTAILATLFFAASVGLAVIAKHKADDARSGGILLPSAVESRELPVAPKGSDTIPSLPSGAAEIPVVPGEASAPSAADDIPQGK